MTGGREQAEHRPGSVRALVLRVRRVLCAARGAECVLLFLAAGLLAWSAGLASGLDGREPLPVALLCGALASISWWCEHPLEPGAMAASLDRRLDQQGALVTAFELDERATRRALNPLEELVRARVLARLGFRAALRALAPKPVVPLVAPVSSALVLLLVLEGRPASAPGAPDLARLAAGLLESLALLAPDPGADAAAAGAGLLARERAAVRDLGDALARSAASGADPAAGRGRLEDLDRRLAALEAGLGAESAARERLARARSWLDALRGGLARADAAAPAVAGPDLTEGAPDGTISGSSTSPNGRASAPDSLATLPVPLPAMPFAGPPGVQAGSFWPREYDGVVERWIELSRAARTQRNQ